MGPAAARERLREAAELSAAGDRAAAEQALRRGLEEAGAEAGTAADAVRRELQFALGGVLYDLGRTGEAALAHRNAAGLARALGERRAETTALLGLAVAQFVLGRYDEALQAALDALRIADEEGFDSQGARACHLAGMVHRNLGRREEALAFFRRSGELARAGGSKSQLVRALNEEGNVLHQLGDDDTAVARKREALELARAAGDEPGISDCLNDLAVIAVNRGRQAEARRYLEEAHAITSRSGDARERVISTLNLAGVLVVAGERARARALLDEALALTATHDLPAEEEGVRFSLSTLHAEAGRPDEAFSELLQAYELRQSIARDEAARRVADLNAVYDSERREAELELLRRDRAIQDLTLEREQGRRRWWTAGFAVALLFAVGLGTGLRMKIRSARALAEAKRRVEELARTDPLTGLANRRHALERLGEEALRTERGAGPFALVLADVDRFKSVNDRHGHECGDRVLAAVAGVLARTLRTLDLAARWGGEEFLLILPGTGRDGAMRAAEKVREGIAANPVSWQEERLPVTATFGVAVCEDGDVDACLRAADAALYRGKEAGRNRVVAAP
ncbi:MAG TPA: diguanylate cyclase [Thermoanaerobaculia bacterium]|nr:diguanylate cyclase [Thermoanaerobaculia bacterium]